MKRNLTKKRPQQTTKKVMVMPKDDWRASYIKDNNLKLIKVKCNKIRRTMTPSIFSNGIKKRLKSSQSTRAFSDPDTLNEARTMEYLSVNMVPKYAFCLEI